MSQIKGFFKRITGDNVSYNALAKQPIIDAENKLNLFKEATGVSITAFDNYLKPLQKNNDSQLADKFLECKDIFRKYESKGDILNANIAHILGIIFGKLSEVQHQLNAEVNELVQSIEKEIIRPLVEYQKEVSIVKENRRELKEAYDRIDQCRSNLEKARRDVDNVQRTNSQSSRITMMGSNESNKKQNDLNRLEDKVHRIEKELDDANSSANEKYDKYTEGLFKRVAEECDLSNFYLEYLKIQRRYHKQALKKIDSILPGIKESLNNYNKKPVFGCSLSEYVNMTNTQTCVSPVIRKLIEGMYRQNVFSEEGIFRVAGSRIKMNCILYAINAGYLEYLDTNNDYDVHCLAGVLKQYIRELPDSILCDELYDEWINSINTPMPKKIDAFKNTLQKLPRANYENLRYLIKFLAKIVENSDKTKMTTQNMGICFGVSLLSSNKSMNSSTSVSNLASHSTNISQIGSGYESSNKSIDMATATNVFDFLLTNHFEVFPGEINFLTGSNLAARQSFHQISNKTSNLQVGENANNFKSNLNTSIISSSAEHPSSHSNRYSVMVNDSFNSLNDTHIASPFAKQSNSVNNSFISPSPSSGSSNIINVNRHIKNNSIDIKFMDQDINQKMFPSLASQQSNSTSTISLDSGSSSPKLRSKKQAPAPPKSDNSQIQASPIETVNEESSDSQSPLSTSMVSTCSVNNIINHTVGKQLNNNSETSISSSASTSSNIINKLSNSSETPSDVLSVPTCPARSSSFKLSENSHSIEKPNQPPPQVPVRNHHQQQPPPIGFNITSFESESAFESPPYPTINTTPKIEIMKNKENINSHIGVSIPTTTPTGTHETINSSVSNISKPPKPTLPRRLGNGIAAHLNKFEKKLEEDVQEERNGDKSSPSEVTSL